MGPLSFVLAREAEDLTDDTFLSASTLLTIN